MHISTVHSSSFLSTCIANAVVNYLLFQSLCWDVEKYYNTHHGRIDVCEVWGQLVRDIPGCTLWKLTKLEPNIQRTRLSMQITGNCALVVWRGALPIEIWTTDRQDIRSDICVNADLNDSDQWCYQLNCSACVCVVHTVEIFFRTADRQDQRSC